MLFPWLPIQLIVLAMVFLLFFLGQVAEELAVGTYCIDFEGVTQSPGGQVEG